MTTIRASQRTRNAVKRRAEAQMLAHIQVLRGNLGGLDPVTGRVGGITSTTVIYDGKARIWSVVGSGVVVVGDGVIDTRQTYVSIPSDSTPVPKRDDLVKVIDDDLSDTDLDLRFFRVLDVDGGGYISATRKLTCTGFYESRYWGEQ